MSWTRLLIALFAPIGVASAVVSLMRQEFTLFGDLSQETRIVTLCLSAVLLVDAWVGSPTPQKRKDEE